MSLNFNGLIEKVSIAMQRPFYFAVADCKREDFIVSGLVNTSPSPQCSPWMHLGFVSQIKQGEGVLSRNRIS